MPNTVLTKIGFFLKHEAFSLRNDLSGILHPNETIVYSSDKSLEAKKTSVFTTELVLFLFLGSFFVIALIAIFVFGFARGDSPSTMSAKSMAPVLWLVGILAFIVFAHKKISKTLKLTSVVMTEKRLFMAPPADCVQKIGWKGPNAVADIIFADQVSAVKGELFGSPCLVFTSINSAYRKIGSERLPLHKRYIPCADVDEAYEHLPVFLKTDEMRFDESPVETPTPRFERAVKFLADRKAKLDQN